MIKIIYLICSLYEITPISIPAWRKSGMEVWDLYENYPLTYYIVQKIIMTINS